MLQAIDIYVLQQFVWSAYVSLMYYATTNYMALCSLNIVIFQKNCWIPRKLDHEICNKFSYYIDKLFGNNTDTNYNSLIWQFVHDNCQTAICGSQLMCTRTYDSKICGWQFATNLCTICCKLVITNLKWSYNNLL